MSKESHTVNTQNSQQNDILFFLVRHKSYLSQTGFVPLIRLKAPTHFPTQSDDPISCYGEPVDRTSETKGLELFAPVVSCIN